MVIKRSLQFCMTVISFLYESGTGNQGSSSATIAAPLRVGVIAVVNWKYVYLDKCVTKLNNILWQYLLQ